jgi:hypothetical protein
MKYHSSQSVLVGFGTAIVWNDMADKQIPEIQIDPATFKFLNDFLRIVLVIFFSSEIG